MKQPLYAGKVVKTLNFSFDPWSWNKDPTRFAPWPKKKKKKKQVPNKVNRTQLCAEPVLGGAGDPAVTETAPALPSQSSRSRRGNHYLLNELVSLISILSTLSFGGWKIKLNQPRIYPLCTSRSVF